MAGAEAVMSADQRSRAARLRSSDAPAAALLVRLLVGVVFLLEGLKKFLFVAQWGAGPWSVDARLTAGPK